MENYLQYRETVIFLFYKLFLKITKKKMNISGPTSHHAPKKVNDVNRIFSQEKIERQICEKIQLLG